MPRQSPYRIVLSATEKRTLTARARNTRARIYKMILLAAEGWSNEAIGAVCGPGGKWCRSGRFFEDRLAGLEDHPPRNAARLHPSLARWSMSELAAETQRSGLVASISGSTIWRWLHPFRAIQSLRPRPGGSWIFTSASGRGTP